MAFLNKYKLHGILCDDMGLGKTLQSICILAGDHYLRYAVQAGSPAGGAEKPNVCRVSVTSERWKTSSQMSCVDFRAQEFSKTKAADCSPLPSLVVCPPTLTGHWVDEVEKFCYKEYLNPLHYTGPPTERLRYGSARLLQSLFISQLESLNAVRSFRLQHQVKRHNLIVASYDVVRNDIDFFR